MSAKLDLDVQTDIIKRANALKLEQERNKEIAFLMLSSSYTKDPKLREREQQLLERTIKIVKENCTNLTKQIQNEKKQLPTTIPKQAVQLQEGFDAVQNTKEMAIRSELKKYEALKDTEIKLQDPTVLMTNFVEDTRRMNFEMDETIQLLLLEKKELTNRLEKELRINQEHQEIYPILEQKLRDLPENDIAEFDRQQLQDKIMRLENDNRNEMEQLAAFIQKNFDETFPGSEYSDKPMLKLSEMLETILNSNEAWLNVNNFSFWPPYLELLSRAGIIVHHQTDNRLIQLAFYE